MANKQRIKVELFNGSGGGLTLMTKGVRDKESIIAAAIEQEEINIDDKAKFVERGVYEVAWLKAVPRDGYSTFYYPVEAGVRGAFLASIVYVRW